MKRQYALKRLLEHGPMTAKEITACTGWSSKETHKSLEGCLRSESVAMRLDSGKKKYVASYYIKCFYPTASNY